MGRLFSLLQGVESSIRSRWGRWMQEVSLAGDLAEVEINAAQAAITQLQVDVTAPGWLSAFITQAAWYVNSTTGNDANDASVGSPIKTLGELTRRFEGRTLSPTLGTLNINLAGTYPTEYLALDFAVAGLTTVNVTGQTTAVDSGTITAYVAEAPATSTRRTLTDAAQDFTTHVRRRVRMTDGAQSGAIAWIGSLGGGVTVANMSAFYKDTGATGNPAAPNAYVVETLDTTLKGYSIKVTGDVVFFVRNVIFATNTVGASSWIDCGGFLHGKFFGCQFITTTNNALTSLGAVTFIACSNVGYSWSPQFCDDLVQGHAVFGRISVSSGGNMVWQSTMHDGNGTDNVSISVANGAYMEDSSARGFFGNVNSTLVSHVLVEDFAQWQMSASASRFWGAAGNTVTNALIVRNGSGVSYVTLPTATGVAPGSDVVLAGAAAIAWGAIPAIAVSPNNAFVNVRQ